MSITVLIHVFVNVDAGFELHADLIFIFRWRVHSSFDWSRFFVWTMGALM